MKALYRGFCRNENGKETIYLNGEAVKGDWVQGSLVERIIEYPDREEIECYIQEMHIGIGDDGFPVYQSGFEETVIPETVSEAVRGFTDKNGRQVFEGDVVKTKEFGKDNGNGVNFNAFIYSIGSFKLNNAHRLFYIIKGQDIEVIGTKWDRKED